MKVNLSEMSTIDFLALLDKGLQLPHFTAGSNRDGYAPAVVGESDFGFA
jgi:hypothetical protein